MGLLNFLGLGKELAEPINAVGSLYTTDKERLDAQVKLADAQAKVQIAQLENNRIMVSSSSFFNSGWPALLGWSSGLMIFMYYMPQILVATYVWGKHAITTNTFTQYPLKPDDLLNLVYLLFGSKAYSLIKKD